MKRDFNLSEALKPRTVTPRPLWVEVVEVVIAMVLIAIVIAGLADIWMTGLPY